MGYSCVGFNKLSANKDAVLISESAGKLTAVIVLDIIDCDNK
jgi:hypothetical protein